MRTSFSRMLAVAAVLALATRAADAQQSGPRWRALAGCWTAAPTVDALIAAPQLLCVTPTTDSNVVDVTTLAAGKVTASQRIDASARPIAVDARGCTGTKRAQWSSDGRRLFLESRATCDGVPRTMTGILTVTPSGQWLDIQGVVAGEGEHVRVARYRPAAVPSDAPAEIAAALRGRELATDGARVAAGASVTPTDVIEASRTVSAAVTEAWLLERGQPFALDARMLVSLADAGVPARVTDAMVAVSNPQAFAIGHPDATPGQQRWRDTTDVVGRRITVTVDPFYSPYDFGYSPYGYYGRYYGFYSPYGYAYTPYLYSMSPYGWYGAPVVVLNQVQPASTPHGRVVKGQGYTQQPATSSTSRGTSPSLSPSSTSGTSGTSGTTSTSTSSSSSTHSSEPARTAHPRP